VKNAESCLEGSVSRVVPVVLCLVCRWLPICGAKVLHNGFLEKVVANGREICKATPRGLEFRERQRKVLDLLNEDALAGKAWKCLRQPNVRAVQMF